MNIGEKIKNARKNRRMTQSELAGDYLTRNMISRIESGVANPSLDTLFYISERLAIPTSYILSDDKDLFFYEKQGIMPKIYEALPHGEYAYCVKKIKNLSRVDDELAYIMVISLLELGKSSVLKGALNTAKKHFSELEKYIGMTRLPTERIKALYELYRALALNIQSPMLEFEEHYYIDGVKNSFDIEFYKYVTMDYDYSYTGIIYKNHVEAKKLISQRKYSAAYELLRSTADLIIASEYNALILFRLYTDIETCCKEMRDFEAAYKYANKRLSMLEGFKT